MVKKGKTSIQYDNVYLKAAACVSGPKEADGPLGEYYDASYPNLYCEQDTWEKAEIQMLRDAFELVLLKASLGSYDVDLVISGDLNNQLAISNYLMRDYDVSFLGIYGACSNSTLGLLSGATFIDSGVFQNVVCMTSSHNATSERQFRYPTEYGGPKPNCTTFTVSAAGAGILSSDESPIKVTRATIGKVVDPGLTDPQDLGRAMAPAAASTLRQHLVDFQIDPSEYDLILTGDLSKYGGKVFLDILKEWNIDIEKNYHDCGMLVYDINKQAVFAGGSGCGCSALVMYGYLYHEMLKGKLNKVLVIATGALMNPIMMAQHESVPAIAHAVCLERVK